MENSEILMYAELLANIRQITVTAAFPSPVDSFTRLELSSDGYQMALHHDGKRSILSLPGRIASNTLLQKPILGRKELSWRLPLAGQATRGDAESNEATWPATSLGEGAEFLCRSCNAVIVKTGTIKVWKDLPSGNWAEMMDFWHCHKPDREPSTTNGVSHNDDLAESKGYGANTKFTASNATGFVDLSSFLLTRSDCTGIHNSKVSSEQSKYQILLCNMCQNHIGHIDGDAEGYRLYKWRLKTADSKPTMASIITAQLQSIMLAQCTSRLLLLPLEWTPLSQQPNTPSIRQEHSEAENPPSRLTFLHLWVLNSAVRYTSTAKCKANRSVPSPNYSSLGQLAMKIFWKVVSESDAKKLMEDNIRTVEEVFLPAETIMEIKKDLMDSAFLLPPSRRRFQDWDVGLLKRFEDTK